jgi:predicted HTH transcriptional regulator
MRAKASDKGVTFRYGVNEQKLFRYLNEYPHITVEQYSNLADINRKKASRILVDLTSLGILKISKKNQTNVFTLSV